MNELPRLTLEEAVKQIEHWCYARDKKGKRTDEYDTKKVKEYLEALYDQMDLGDWQNLAEAYKGVALGKNFEEKRRRGRPPGAHYGCTQAERQAALKAEARKLGVWHVHYPDGCTECGRKDYAHASGGICSRCRETLRNAGIKIKDYRRMKKEGVLYSVPE